MEMILEILLDVAYESEKLTADIKNHLKVIP